MAKGARATGRYIPVIEERPPDFDQAKQGILRKWDETSKKLLAVLQGWNEERLDKYLLPHPILGKLTIREMLFFTLYHDIHHVNNVRKLLGQAMFEEIASGKGASQ
ncbi:DinB family protein [candidate division KSB1 bacterium]|nr:DinB family protein [candidate division KSB1 bacterium]